MKNFGKLTGTIETVAMGTGGEVKIHVLHDQNGVDWHVLFRQFPHPWYIAVQGDGTIISMESDPEQSQISGREIWGIDSNFGFTRGAGGTVYGKIWDGSKIVARPLTRDELFPPLQKWRVEAIIDLHNLREKIDAAIDALPEPQRTTARSKRQYVTEFSRADALFDFIGRAVNKTPEEVDSLWQEALSL
jgi:hypothetical protein